MPGLKFDGSINLGNLLSVLLLLGGLTAAWHQLDARLIVVEVNQGTMNHSLTELTSRTTKTEEFILAHNPDYLNMLTKSRPVFAPTGHVAGDVGAMFGGSMAADAPAEKAPNK